MKDKRKRNPAACLICLSSYRILLIPNEHQLGEKIGFNGKHLHEKEIKQCPFWKRNTNVQHI